MPAHDTDPSTTPSTVPKFSRYASVRRNSKQSVNKDESISGENKEGDGVAERPSNDILSRIGTKEKISKNCVLDDSESNLRMSTASTQSRSPRVSLDSNIGDRDNRRSILQISGPISASNVGECYVQAWYGESSTNLQITPETTALDLLQSGANMMTQEDVDVSHLEVLESYHGLGLERELRLYERVLDVLSSWGRNQQNTLTIHKTNQARNDRDTHIVHIPKFAPNNLTLFMFYSQQPGKWNKCYVTLLSTGQIFISRSPDSKVADEDAFSICHLSKYDIYRTTSRKLKETIRPPKQICLGIKSQKNPNLLPKDEGLVHLFSTDDEEIAEKWYDSVRKWRSWHLASRAGERDGKTKQPESASVIGHSERSTGDRSSSNYEATTNLNMSSRYSEEEIWPRESPSELGYAASGGGRPLLPRQSRSLPPISDHKAHFPSNLEGIPMRNNSVISRSNAQRRPITNRFPIDGATSNSSIDDPPTLCGRCSHELSSSSDFLSSGSLGSPPQGTSVVVGRQRTISQRQKPLIDLTPTFKEAPQWDMSKKGHGVKGIPGVPLVEFATGAYDHYGALHDMPRNLLRRE